VPLDSAAFAVAPSGPETGTASAAGMGAASQVSPKWRVRAAWLLVAASCIGWPVSALTVARDEPQFVLGLSWGAILLTALDIVSTSDVREKQEDERGGG
jgi:hypothetical protein